MSYVCEFCKKEYEEWPGKFCDRCGRVMARLNVEPEEEIPLKRCGKCGHRNEPEKKVCDNCGELLHDPNL